MHKHKKQKLTLEQKLTMQRKRRKLLRKYRKILQAPDWSKEELAELGPALGKMIERKQIDKDVVEASELRKFILWIKCRTCGKKFVLQDSRKRYCSAGCRWQAWSKRHPNARKRPKHAQMQKSSMQEKVLPPTPMAAQNSVGAAQNSALDNASLDNASLGDASLDNASLGDGNGNGDGDHARTPAAQDSVQNSVQDSIAQLLPNKVMHRGKLSKCPTCNQDFLLVRGSANYEFCSKVCRMRGWLHRSKAVQIRW